jgi:S-adenosylmethionine synthetase
MTPEMAADPRLAGLIVEAMPDPALRAAEFVECKGPGHPDTLCDAIAEAVSRALSNHYLARFGRILHHNVDKVLLIGGEAAPRFGGGRLVKPIRIVLAGRATARVGDVAIPVDAIAREAAAAVLSATVPRLDCARDVEWESRIRPGSADLGDLFARGAVGEALANDTSAGAGFAPLSPLELLVRDATAMIASPSTRPSPACGADVKVAGIRRERRFDVTVACAGVGAGLEDLDGYLQFRKATQGAVAGLARARLGDAAIDVAINAADDPRRGACYLTVTGTSAENGDDGETGRGNRVNGIIAVGRPMSMEATAGKNAVSHVGKLYNVVAQDLAEAIVAGGAGVVACEVVLACRIGCPITTPALAHLRVAPAHGVEMPEIATELRSRMLDALSGVGAMWKRIVAGELRLF